MAVEAKRVKRNHRDLWPRPAIHAEPSLNTPSDSSSSATDRGISSHVDKMERSEEHTSEHQSLMRNLYAVLCFKKNKHKTRTILDSPPFTNDLTIHHPVYYILT